MFLKMGSKNMEGREGGEKESSHVRRERVEARAGRWREKR